MLWNGRPIRCGKHNKKRHNERADDAGDAGEVREYGCQNVHLHKPTLTTRPLYNVSSQNFVPKKARNGWRWFVARSPYRGSKKVGAAGRRRDRRAKSKCPASIGRASRTVL